MQPTARAIAFVAAILIPAHSQPGAAQGQRPANGAQRRSPTTYWQRVAVIPYQPTNKVVGLQFGPDGRHLLVVTRTGLVSIVDATTGTVQRELTHSRGVFAVSESAARSADDLDRRVLTLDFAGSVHLWDLSKSATRHALPLGTTPVDTTGAGTNDASVVRGAAITSDGGRIVALHGDRTLRVWNAASGKQLLASDPQPGLMHRLMLNEDGTSVLTLDQSRTARLWNTYSLQQEQTVAGTDGAAFCKDGTMLTASLVTPDNNVRAPGLLFEATSWTRSGPLASAPRPRFRASPSDDRNVGFTDPLFSFSGDCQTLVSARGNGMLIQNLSDEEPRLLFTVPSSGPLGPWVSSFAISTDGRTAAGSYMNVVELWRQTSD